MFISICVYAQCSWLEVESPTYATIADCEVNAQITRLELVSKFNDSRITVGTECITSEDTQQFRQDHTKSPRLTRAVSQLP